MAKLVKCKTCGAMIAKNAKTCPHCGARRKKHPILGIVLVILGISLFIAGFSNASSSNDNSNSATSGPANHEVGERVEIGDAAITLIDVTENSGGKLAEVSEKGNKFVVCEFEIENNAESDLSVSSLLSFTAYIDDCLTSISVPAMVSAGKTQLDGVIISGKKMRGVVGYETNEDWRTIEIRFTNGLWSGKEVIFKYSK